MAKIESKVQGQITKYLKKSGYWPVKVHLCSENGWPDLMCIGYKHIFYIEVKSPGEKARPLQEFIHDKIREFGHDVIVADSKQDVIDYLTKSKKIVYPYKKLDNKIDIT